ncbi:hypothetical protein N2152v2_001768 [Parachlorella kessleri]
MSCLQHWEEKNRLEWSRQRLAELLEGLAADIDRSIGEARVTQLKSLTGEALLTKRKGNKKFAVFDLKLTLAWEGKWSMEDAENPTVVSGEVSISEFASMGDHDDIVFGVTATGSSEAHRQLRQAVEALRPHIFSLLDQFAKELQDS